MIRYTDWDKSYVFDELKKWKKKLPEPSLEGSLDGEGGGLQTGRGRSRGAPRHVCASFPLLWLAVVPSLLPCAP